jgi:hypothetical protein
MRSCLAAILSLTLAHTALADDGFRPLFNGKDLSGWQDAKGGGPGTGWKVEEGAMNLTGGGGYIWTKERFGDFVLDLEFKTTGNSGIFIRTDKPTNCVQTGIEIQVERPTSKPNKHSVGALYDLLAPSKDPTKANDWNHVTITAKGSKIAVVINGEGVIDADLDQWTQPRKNPDGSGNKFGTALKDFKREGHIGFQDHGAKVSYRNVKIKAL